MARKFVSIKSAEFFKVFLPHLSSHRLMISPDFVKDFKRTIREKIILRDVCGKEMHVYVKETPEGVFLESGWESYIDSHSLKAGEFLVLRYVKAFSFMVKIFGTNGCKKKKKALHNAHVKIEDEMEEEPTSCKRPKEDQKLKVNTERSERFEELNESEDQNVVSECPSFVSPICKSRLRKAKLRIPDELIKKYNLQFETEVILRNENGKEWHANVINYNTDARLLGKGWLAFQIENNVGSNDCCKLTFDNTETVCKMINVQILHSGQDLSPKNTLKRGRGRPPRKIKDDNFWVEETVKPSDEKVPCSDELPEFFQIYMPDLYSETMKIPPDFIEEFGENIPTVCTLKNSSGLSWKVDMKRVDDHWVFQNGWSAFVDENSIQEYDFLTFAYARNSTFYVKVYLRNGCLKMTEEIDDETSEELLEDEDDEESEQESPKRRRRTRSSTRTESSIERESVNANPSFTLRINKSYLKNSYMSIKMWFWATHLRERTGMATLLIENTRWNMSLTSTGDRVRLVGNVSEFVRKNSLKIGSICTFELIDINNLTFQVTIHG